MKSLNVIQDIANYVARTEQLDGRDRLALALELIRGSNIRPEVGAYLREAIGSPEKPEISKALSMLIGSELSNEAEGGDSPTTLGTVKDSVAQMDDEVLAEIINESPGSARVQQVRAEIDSLVELLGCSLPVKGNYDKIKWS